MLDAETGGLRFSRTAGEMDRPLALCVALESPVRVAYEAGPTGFGLARAPTAAAIGAVSPRARSAAEEPGHAEDPVGRAVRRDLGRDRKLAGHHGLVGVLERRAVLVGEDHFASR